MADEVARYLREEHAAVAELALWTCAEVRASNGDLEPRVYRGWRGIGFRHPEAGYVCGVFPRDDRVELLFERGAELADPDRVLEGTGTQTRSIVVVAEDAALARTIRAYVQQAIAQRLLDRGR